MSRALEHSADRRQPTEAGRIMSSVADELDRMRSLGLQIETSLCELAGGVAEQGVWLEDLQQFDLILQQLAALRDFLTTAAATQGADAPIDIADAADKLTLHDLRLRLLGQDAGERHRDCHFFEEDSG
ncbi:MAG TPA: hypothetical protein VEA80_15160 [Vitreimonas sp.]|uniref:hypothetical protein n=1 Tax=Vitreimonas sp. TaxID=3069702 RepID=UPI002D54D829|nr:hypothetical protein [Vitreimonas sp.]HYD88812.1 hypothetical protein [Vitreimonas sp.]